MLVIRRMVDRTRGYTAIFLPGEEPQIFPTTDQEHARILQIYKQDRPYDGIVNDFTDFFPAEKPPSPAQKAKTRRGRSRDGVTRPKQRAPVD